MKKRNKKIPFSLIELFICLFLIVMTGSLLGLKGYSLIKRARFDSMVQAMKNNLRECRELACLHGEDVVYQLQKKKDETLSSKGFEGGFLKQEIFPHLFFTFDGKESEILTFRFCGSSFIGPLGKLSFFTDSSHKEKVSHTLDLEKFFQWSEKNKKQ